MNRETRRRLQRSGKSRVTTTKLKVKSQQTPLEVEFSNIDALEKIAESYVEKQKQVSKSDLLRVLPFWNWLKGQQAPPQDALTVFKAPLYRIVFNGFDPISIAGSLADGGRYNVGGVQQIDIPGTLTVSKEGALYLADSVQCAQAEAGDFLQNAEYYKIELTRELNLWDVEKLVGHFSWPGLAEALNLHPYGMKWSLQKVPTISQLLAHQVRKLDCDGLISGSTKHGDGKVVTLFLLDDVRAGNLLTKTKITI